MTLGTSYLYQIVLESSPGKDTWQLDQHMLLYGIGNSTGCRCPIHWGGNRNTAKVQGHPTHHFKPSGRNPITRSAISWMSTLTKFFLTAILIFQEQLEHIIMAIMAVIQGISPHMPWMTRAHYPWRNVWNCMVLLLSISMGMQAGRQCSLTSKNSKVGRVSMG